MDLNKTVLPTVSFVATGICVSIIFNGSVFFPR
jgi:hypothetical protein